MSAPLPTTPLGRAVAKARGSRTQVAFARVCGLSEPALRNIEKGRSLGTIESLEGIAKGAPIDMERLLRARARSKQRASR